MEPKTTGVSDAAEPTLGESIDNGNDGAQGSVSYQTHKRLLSQLKKTQEELAKIAADKEALQKEREALEEKKLQEQGEQKKLAELYKKRLEQAESEKEEYKNKILDAHKLNSFKEALSKYGQVAKPNFYSFANIGAIQFDESGEIDRSSVEAVVNEFVTNFPELLVKGNSKMPNAAPMGAKPSLTYEEWSKLPIAEQRKRLSEVMGSNKN